MAAESVIHLDFAVSATYGERIGLNETDLTGLSVAPAASALDRHDASERAEVPGVRGERSLQPSGGLRALRAAQHLLGRLPHLQGDREGGEGGAWLR